MPTTPEGEPAHGRKATVLPPAADPPDMQRRAAAVYVAILSLVALGAAYVLWAGFYPNMKEEFWAVGAMSGLTAVVLLASAYMPVRGD